MKRLLFNWTHLLAQNERKSYYLSFIGKWRREKHINSNT